MSERQQLFRPDSQKPSWCKLRKFCWLWSCCGCLPWCCFFFIKTRPTSVTSASDRQKQFYKWHQMSSSPLRNRTRCTFNTAMPIRLKCNKYYWTVVQLFGKHTHIYSNIFALRPRQEQCVKQTGVSICISIFMLKKSMATAHCFFVKRASSSAGFFEHFNKLANLGFFGMIFYQEKAKKNKLMSRPDHSSCRSGQ